MAGLCTLTVVTIAPLTACGVALRSAENGLSLPAASTLTASYQSAAPVVRPVSSIEAAGGVMVPTKVRSPPAAVLRNTRTATALLPAGVPVTRMVVAFKAPAVIVGASSGLTGVGTVDSRRAGTGIARSMAMRWPALSARRNGISPVPTPLVNATSSSPPATRTRTSAGAVPAGTLAAAVIVLRMRVRGGDTVLSAATVAVPDARTAPVASTISTVAGWPANSATVAATCSGAVVLRLMRARRTAFQRAMCFVLGKMKKPPRRAALDAVAVL